MSIRKMSLIALGLVCSLQLIAQNRINQSPKLELGLQLGVTEFLGDLGGGAAQGRPFILDTDWRYSRPLIGAYMKQHFNDWLAASGNLNFTMLKGSDSATTNPARAARGLEFTSNIVELYGLVHLQPIKMGKIGIRANLGLGVFAYNPQTNTETTNQNTLIDNIQVMFPIGMGVSYRLNQNIVLGADIMHRVTLTDDIDGYIYQGTDSNDSFYSLNFKVGYTFGGTGWGSRNKLGCPGQQM